VLIASHCPKQHALLAITGPHAEWLAGGVLAQCRALVHLDLSGNWIEAAEADSLAGVLVQNMQQLQQSCNTAATDLQQTCNRPATDLSCLRWLHTADLLSWCSVRSMDSCSMLPTCNKSCAAKLLIRAQPQASNTALNKINTTKIKPNNVCKGI
jgi:hypothetical protein